jgi:LEA14-like dessication related protein
VNVFRFCAASLASVVLLASSGCTPPDPPTLVARSAAVKSISLTGLQLDVQVDATNPNGSDLTAQKVTGKVAINGQPLGTIEVPQNVTLPAKATTPITATLDSPWQNVQTLAPLAATGKPIPYTVDGTVNVGGAHINVDLPFHLDGVITPQQMRAAVAASLPPGLKF